MRLLWDPTLEDKSVREGGHPVWLAPVCFWFSRITSLLPYVQSACRRSVMRRAEKGYSLRTVAMAASLTSPHIELGAARLTDSHGRVIHDLRVSVTDRCNYKCVYCRTGEDGPQNPKLAIAEYLLIIPVFVDLAITKVRLTAGEPVLGRSPG